MSQLTELVEKSIEALRAAEAAGVVQVIGALGGSDGCRCAEGVVADVLVAEGLAEVDMDADKIPSRLRWTWKGGFSSRFGLEGILPLPLVRLGRVWGEKGPIPISELNDADRMTFGQIADRMEESLREGFYE